MQACLSEKRASQWCIWSTAWPSLCYAGSTFGMRQARGLLQKTWGQWNHFGFAHLLTRANQWNTSTACQKNLRHNSNKNNTDRSSWSPDANLSGNQKWWWNRHCKGTQLASIARGPEAKLLTRTHARPYSSSQGIPLQGVTTGSVSDNKPLQNNRWHVHTISQHQLTFLRQIQLPALPKVARSNQINLPFHLLHLAKISRLSSSTMPSCVCGSKMRQYTELHNSFNISSR